MINFSLQYVLIHTELKRMCTGLNSRHVDTGPAPLLDIYGATDNTTWFDVYCLDTKYLDVNQGIISELDAYGVDINKHGTSYDVTNFNTLVTHSTLTIRTINGRIITLFRLDSYGTSEILAYSSDIISEPFQRQARPHFRYAQYLFGAWIHVCQLQ